MSHALVVGNLSKSFPNSGELWSGVSIQFEPFALHCISGPSGCGKTTLLNCIGMLEKPSTGSISWGEVELVGLSPRARRELYRNHIAFMLQGLGLIEGWSVEKNLMLVPRLKKLRRNDVDAEIDRVLELVSLPDKKDSSLYELSGGQQQRIAFARALLQQPSLLLVDEPTASLDQENSELIVSMLRDAAQSGVMVIVSTHDPVVLAVADNIVDLGDYR